MARVEAQKTGQVWTKPNDIQDLLGRHGIVYEQWDISKLEGADRPDGMSEEQFLLSLFEDEIATISEQRGYHSADVIALSPKTDGLDTVLAKFDKEHTHAEDEVRFTVSGRGIFAVRGRDGEMYSVEVQPGDLLAVPEGTHHYFTLCSDKQIQCIRLFTEKSGWVADYVEGGSSAADITPS